MLSSALIELDTLVAFDVPDYVSLETTEFISVLLGSRELISLELVSVLVLFESLEFPLLEFVSLFVLFESIEFISLELLSVLVLF